MSKYDYIKIYDELISNGDKHNIRLLIQYLQDYTMNNVEYEFENENDWDEEEDW